VLFLVGGLFFGDIWNVFHGTTCQIASLLCLPTSTFFHLTTITIRRMVGTKGCQKVGHGLRAINAFVPECADDSLFMMKQAYPPFTPICNQKPSLLGQVSLHTNSCFVSGRFVRHERTLWFWCLEHTQQLQPRRCLHHKSMRSSAKLFLTVLCHLKWVVLRKDPVTLDAFHPSCVPIKITDSPRIGLT